MFTMIFRSLKHSLTLGNGICRDGIWPLVWFCFYRSEASHPSLLSTAGLFNCPDDNSPRFLARQIRDSQMRDRLAAPGLLFCIAGNLGDLYCHPWSLPIDYRNLSFFFLSQATPPKWHSYVTLLNWSTAQAQMTSAMTTQLLIMKLC